MMKWWFSLSKLARTLIIIAIIVLVALVIYLIMSSRKKRKITQQFNDDYNQLTQTSQQKPTYLQTNYQSFADKIYEAGCVGVFCYGTDEEAIYDVFRKMENDLDVLLLIKAFGLREQRGIICIIPGTCGKSMAEWLQSELASNEFQEINTILSGKGIKYQF